LAGRYTVLMPNTARGGGISRKITNPQDRKRLKSIANELEVPEGMGLIIRTAGAARTKQEIRRDFEYLLRLWESVRELTLESTAPSLVYEEGNLIKRSIRDLYNKDVDEVVVAGDHAYREAKDFMRMLMPSHAKNVVAFKDPEPLFTRYQIERQLNAMFSPQVTLKSGGYLVINQTEALVAVDVNSGRSTREFSIEETALHTNLEAAEELARQLKLRDLAGLIVIDFIDMDEKRNNRAVERKLKDALRHDRARIQVGRISHFGLLEMSRQRMRTGVLEGSTTQCVHCQGTGIIRSTESISLAVLRGLEDAVMSRQRGSLTATTTSDVALYILNNKRDFVVDMENRCGYAIAIEASEKMVGANFAIERGPASAPPKRRAADKAAVNMDWGFETDDENEETTSEIETTSDGEDVSARSSDDEAGGRKRRRRRRRGGRRTSETNAEDIESREDGEETDTAREASSDDTSGDLGEGDDSENGDDDKPRSRRGRRRGRRGGRRNRERQAQREDASEDTTNGDEAESDNEDSDIPGFGPQPSVSAGVIEITTPGAADAEAPEALATSPSTTDASEAQSDTNEDKQTAAEASAADDVGSAEQAANDSEDDKERPKRRSRARSGTGRASTRKAKPKTDAEEASATVAGDQSTGSAEQVELTPGVESVKAQETTRQSESAADPTEDLAPDRSKRTAPIIDKPRVERVTVGPNGDVNPDETERLQQPAEAASETPTEQTTSRRGWWQRRILGE
ncbi:MAG: Rne/Rng family ribonuclease, partial [Pseudomonadota bacterium]